MPSTTIKKTSRPKTKEIEQLEVFYPEQLNIFYSNHTNFVISNMDLTMDFGLRHNEIIKNKIKSTVQMNSRIIMSPQHAKTFLVKLQDLIEKYEKDFGEIKTEPKKK